MKRFLFVTLFILWFLPFLCNGQFSFSGQIDPAQLPCTVYLSVIDDYRKISGVYPEQILAKAIPDSTGHFSFSGNNLHAANRIYRIHADSCSEEDQAAMHFNGHCSNSKEILFIANNTDTLSLPFSFDNEMFCRVRSSNEKAAAFLKIDSLKNDMRFAFGSYRSEANRKANSKKWFGIFQEYGEQLNEPLAELYSYAFLSDRANSLYAYYLEDLKSNPYYDGLLERLSARYPATEYTIQYQAELTSDKFLIASGATPLNRRWWYIAISILFLSLLGNVFLFQKIHRIRSKNQITDNTLSVQEKKVLEMILENKTNKEIASHLFLSVSTIKSHINNIYKKLGVSSREQVKAIFLKGL